MMGFRARLFVVALCWVSRAIAADFGTPGGPLPPNLDAISGVLHEQPYELELLISFGTSKGGSAGHLALAVRDGAPGDDLVYSANFYADRDPAHEADFHTDDLMVSVPKMEYLFGTTSSLGAKASFGLDFGEVYKRSVVGVRVSGVPVGEKEALAAFFARINQDFHARASDTEYHEGEVRYDYLHLNCAKTIGAAFKHGAGYTDLNVTRPRRILTTRVASARRANVPTEMAMKLIEEWDRRGYRMDVVLYKKYAASPYVDPLEKEAIAFKDLPNRFPSVLSRDFRREQGAYEDFDNLYAMYLLYNLGRYSIVIDERTRQLAVEAEKSPMGYREAAKLAERNARSDSRGYLGKLLFRPQGVRIGEVPDNSHLYDFKPAEPAR